MRTFKLSLFFFFIINNILAQESVFFNNYRDYSNFREGIYVQESVDTLDNYDCIPILNNIPLLKNEEAFINPNGKRIVLFDDYRITKRNAVKQLLHTTPVKIDSTFYNWIYKEDTTKKWSFPSFDVWNRVIIDSVAYYLDYDLHDYVRIINLEETSQKLYIIGEYSGYDYNYHSGYPEYFFFIFTDQKGKVIHETKIFFGVRVDDEYGMIEDFFKKNWNSKTKAYELQLFNEMDKNQKLNFTWKNNQFKEIK